MSKTKVFVGLGLAALVLAGAGWYFKDKNGKTPRYRLEKVEKGDVVSTVTATGTLAAVTTVKVGSQVSGIISQLYADFNSEVKKGQLLAELDPTTFQAQLDQRRADLERARVDVRNTKTAFDRAQNLLNNELLSESDFDTAQANMMSAEASVKQAQAALRQAETNLSHTKIESPIDGIVVNREYDIGQTVAASFQAPTLFTIAQDLTLMQVSTNIDEADIGRIKMGAAASFTVDAFPDQTFEGAISQIRLTPQVVNNVVTYTVLIDVSNPDLKLKPGMTANVLVPVEKVADALKVPNAALRFKPDPADLAGGESRGKPEEKEKSGGSRKKESTVYILTAEGKLKAIEVSSSLTDGAFTAVAPGPLKEGDQIVVGLETTRAMEATGGFGSQRRRGGF